MEYDPLTHKKKRAKGKILLIVLIFLLAGLGYGYFWYKGITVRDEAARVALSENESLKAEVAQLSLLKDDVAHEYTRCQEFISQREGNFGSFEYCQKFIEWVNARDAE
jgi:flagellar basal body-associated protein FliL